VQEVPSSRATLRFADFEIDSRSGEVRKNGIRVKLQEQPFQVLRILLDQPGEVVTRQELQRRIWPADIFVDFDHGLYNAVKRLREALGDTADTPRFIETLPKRGYRFIGTLSEQGGTDVSALVQQPARETINQEASARRSLWIVIVFGLIAVAAVLAFWLFR